MFHLSATEQTVRGVIARLIARQSDRPATTERILESCRVEGITALDAERALGRLHAEGMLNLTRHGWGLRAPPGRPDATLDLAAKARLHAGRAEERPLPPF